MVGWLKGSGGRREEKRTDIEVSENNMKTIRNTSQLQTIGIYGFSLAEVNAIYAKEHNFRKATLKQITLLLITIETSIY